MSASLWFRFPKGKLAPVTEVVEYVPFIPIVQPRPEAEPAALVLLDSGRLVRARLEDLEVHPRKKAS